MASSDEPSGVSDLREIIGALAMFLIVVVPAAIVAISLALRVGNLILGR